MYVLMWGGGEKQLWEESRKPQHILVAHTSLTDTLLLFVAHS